MNFESILRLAIFALFAVLAFLGASCGESNSVDKNVNTIEVDSNLIIKENLVNAIVQEDCVLSNGTRSRCFLITVKAKPKEHKMGPWCPETITDSKDSGGIWFRDGKIYDVDGPFIANLDKFYSDPEWKLYREDGSVKVTATQEACEAAARPDVDEKYHNYCVQCAPSYYESKEITYRIPVKPVFMKFPTAIGRDGIGLAFNGVPFDPAAPVHAILAAHTLAPLDDCGGHVNPHKGYHYHAANGCSKEASKEENHPPLLGYALDGFGIYALKNEDGKEPDDLDDCRGHTDEKRGYHYHAGRPGDNKIIGCFRGDPGSVSVESLEREG
ncbi:MAG: YHYH protein [Pyrinomonadaceae bacterium]|nr:YHYH protein [Pyrinomonadaceae bacterium]